MTAATPGRALAPIPRHALPVLAPHLPPRLRAGPAVVLTLAVTSIVWVPAVLYALVRLAAGAAP